MKISNNYAVYNSCYQNKLNSPKTNIQKTIINSSVNLNNYSYNDFLMFTSRVDKGLKRFYEFNKDRMPITLKNYIESLKSQEEVEPIDALINAFEGLIIADNIQDVKDFYPDEPLFQNLIPFENTKAKRGILYDARIMQKDFREYDEGILKSKEDISVYLLKKIFLEAKSIPEINQDLDSDLNPVFQKTDKNYITYSTLNALGIQLPNREYITSLRYTKPGYSDEIGAKIAEIQKKSTQKRIRKEKNTNDEFVNKYFKKPETENKPKRKASEETREKLSRIKQQQWQEMPAEEKQKVIERLLSANKFQHYIMVDAWNNLDDVRYALSDYFLEKNIFDIDKIIYGKKKFTDYQSALMKTFWETHPQCAKRLGEEMSKSYEMLKSAEENGNFDELTEKIEIIASQKRKEAKIRKKQRKQEVEQKNTTQTIEELKKIYHERHKNYPEEHNKIHFDIFAKFFGIEDLKILTDENVNSNEIIPIVTNKFKQIPGKEFQRSFNALEYATLKIIFEATNNEFPQLYTCDNYLGMLADVFAVKEFPHTFEIKTLNGSTKYTLYKKPEYERLNELFEKYNNPPRSATKQYLCEFFKSISPSERFYLKHKDGLIKFINLQGSMLDEVCENPESKEAAEIITALFLDFKKVVNRT